MSDRTARWGLWVILLVSFVLLWGIESMGIWDPWELEAADAARADGGSQRPMLRPWLIAHAFRALGDHGWVGRVPGAIAAGISCLVLFFWVRKDVGRRAAVGAVVVMATSPLFLLNARLMMGDAVSVAAQAWVGLAAFQLCGSPASPSAVLARMASLGAAVVASTWATGVLLGPLPPLLAVATWTVLVRDVPARSISPASRWVLALISTALIVGVAKAVGRDGNDFDWWIGGGVVGGDPPTWDAVFEVVFHGFAPWSALLPFAVLAVVTPRSERATTTQDSVWVWVLWTVFAYAASTLFASRYGHPTTALVVPLSGIVAVWLAEIDATPRRPWGTAIGVALLFGLLIRDFAIYPESALRAISAEGLSVPREARTTLGWAATLSAACVGCTLFLLSPPGLKRPSSAQFPSRLRRSWESGVVERAWVTIGGLLVMALVGFGALCFLVELPVPSIVIRVGRVLFFVPFVVAALIFALPRLSYLVGSMGGFRIWVLWPGGVITALFLSLSVLPTMSQHLSPRSVYDTYAELAGSNEQPLAVYRMSAGSAPYYTATPVVEINDKEELISYLESGGQRWTILSSEELPRLNRAYRRRVGRHLYVADATNATLLLAAALPVEDRPNESFLAANVLDASPRIAVPVDANFNDQVMLLGYELALPDGDTVGAGQQFSVTWFWQSIGKRPRGHDVFVHIDAFGQRINGDHVPVEGRYPFRHWVEGDVVVDRQTLRVPANFRPGDYKIYVGVFKGETRLDVITGTHDGANRVEVGVLRVR